LQDDVVGAADEEERWRPHLAQVRHRQVGPAAARDDRADACARFGRGPQRGGRAGAGAEVPDRQVRVLGARVVGDRGEARREELDVEDVAAVALLGRITRDLPIADQCSSTLVGRRTHRARGRVRDPAQAHSSTRPPERTAKPSSSRRHAA
jgi:hypothetical protein